MKVVILCGGQGTRLREETAYRPKPMVEIGGRPILWHIMKLYAFYGYKEFVLCLGYKGDVIKEYFLNYHAMQNDFTVDLGSNTGIQFHGRHEEDDWKVTLVDTGADTLTAERIYQVRNHLDDDAFMVTYGDGIADLDVASLLAYHKSQGGIATLSGYQDVSRFGVVEANHMGWVTGFKEKPQVQEQINVGFFVFEPEIFKYLAGQATMLEKVLPQVAEDQKLAIYAHTGFWHCMDTYRDFLSLNEMWQAGNAPWAVWQT